MGISMVCSVDDISCGAVLKRSLADANIMVDGDEISGVIDFGDSVER